MTLTKLLPVVTRRSALKGILAGAAAGTLGAPLVARAQATTLRAAHIESPESAIHKGFVAFADKVREATGGAVDVQVFPASQLGGLRDLYEGLSLGSVDLTASAPDYTANTVPLMTTACLYYSYQDSAHVDRALDGPFAERLAEELRSKAGWRILAWGELGWRSVFSTVRPIDGPSDFRGLKIRVPEVQIHLVPMRALGATSTPIPYSEVYTAMQTGIADSAEGTPAAVHQQKFNEVSKFYSLTNHLYNPMHIVIGDNAFNRLSDSQKQVVGDAAREAFGAQRHIARDDNDAALKVLADSGLAINEPDVEAIRAAVEPTWAELTSGLGAEGKECLDLLLNA